MKGFLGVGLWWRDQGHASWCDVREFVDEDVAAKLKKGPLLSLESTHSFYVW